MESPPSVGPLAESTPTGRADGGGDAPIASRTGGEGRLWRPTAAMEELDRTFSRQLEVLLQAQQDANDELHDLREQNDRLKDECQAAAERETAVNQKHALYVQATTIRLSSLLNGCRSLRQDHSDLRSQIGEDVERLKADCATRFASVELAVQQAASSLKEHHEQKTAASVSAAVAEAERTAEQAIEDLRRQLEAADARSQRLEAEKEAVERQLVESTAEIARERTTADDEKRRLEERLADHAEKERLLAADVERQRRAFVDLSHQLARANVQIDEANERCCSLTVESRQLTAELQRKSEELQRTADELAAAKEAAENLRIQRERAESEREMLEGQLESERKRLAAANSDHTAELEAARREAAAERADFERELEQRTARIVQLEEHKRLTAQRVVEHVNKADALLVELGARADTVDSLRADLLAARSELDAERKRSAELAIKQEPKEEVDLQAAETSAGAQREAEQRNRDLQTAVDGLTERQHELERQLQELSAANQELEQEVEVQEGLVAFLMEEAELLERNDSKRTGGKNDALKKLREMEDQLRKANLKKRTEKDAEIKRLKAELIQMQKTHDAKQQNLTINLKQMEANYERLKEDFAKFRQQHRKPAACNGHSTVAKTIRRPQLPAVGSTQHSSASSTASS
ncbi:hypothetical protein M3Y99_00982900 [Aphelenchoides fujianensis]|nr:hypothetical protein M3Y99_00982900 [Aphelenchoides fujianensis]